MVITSGGEARKLMMARALYKTPPPSCCWTNPPAALAPVWEYEVYRRFRHISGGRTSVSISHRLASCRFCGEILVFAASSSGAAIGSCWRRRQYAQLWHAQAQHDTDAL